MRAGKPLPKKLQDEPELWPHNVLFFNSFLDLNTTRALGFGAGPLSWQAIQDYCVANDFDEYQIEAAHVLLRQMDTLFLTLMDKKERQKQQLQKEADKRKRNQGVR
jgi:hypothetical protein